MDAVLRIGRYAVFDAIGSGGTAAVHLGCKLGEGAFVRIVAVKRLRADRLKEAEFVTMLVDEARLGARLTHPNTVPVVDVVRTDEELLLVSEYVHGETLAALVRAEREKNERVAPAIASAIVVGMLNGLHAAHTATDERGEALHVIHRDVSPQNVMIATDGHPRILDFGMAKARGRITATAEGVIKGKLAYMAPEHLQGKKLDAGADIWSAGVVLWELLAGKRLFAGGEEEMLEQILLADVSPPSRYAKAVSPALDDVVMRALEQDPAKRFASAEEMARALAEAEAPAYASEVGAWVESLAADKLAARTEVLSRCEREASALRKTAKAPAPVRSRKVIWIAGAIGAVAMGGAIAYGRAGASAGTSVGVGASVSASVSVSVSEENDVEPLPSAIASAAPHRKVRPNPCSPPWTTDPQGRRIYKRECLK